MHNNDQEYHDLRIAVPASFADVFPHFYYAANKSGQRQTKTLLPSFQTILIFNFGPGALLRSKQNTEIKVNQCMVLGPIKNAFDYTLPAGTEILVANFKGDAFYRFFGNAVLAEHVPVNPDELIKENCFADLWHELKKLNSQQEKVDYILDFCKPYLKNRSATSELLTAFDDTVLDPIKTIAKEMNQSERNIQLRHKQYLGYSAKEINRYYRFLKAVEFIRDFAIKQVKPDWFEVIDQCGYYDQSQLIHDFKFFLNLSPARFLKFQQDICCPREL